MWLQKYILINRRCSQVKRILAMVCAMIMMMCCASAQTASVQETAAAVIARDLGGAFDAALYACTVTGDEADGYTVSWAFQRTDEPVATVHLSGEEASAEYSSECSLSWYYEEMNDAQDAIFRNWPVTEKAWLRTVLPEYARMDALLHAKKQPDQPYVQPAFVAAVLEFPYAVPGEDVIPEAQALDMAVADLVKNHEGDEVALKMAAVSAAFLQEEGAEGCWRFQFYIRGVMIHEVWLNAVTGEAPAMTGDEALYAAKTWLRSEKGVEKTALDSAAVSIHYLGGEAPCWALRFTGLEADMGLVLVDDATGAVTLE